MEIGSIMHDVVKIGGILVSLVHFLVGFVFYRDMVRMARVLRTKNTIFFMAITNIYILILLVILIIFFFV